MKRRAERLARRGPTVVACILAALTMMMVPSLATSGNHPSGPPSGPRASVAEPSGSSVATAVARPAVVKAPVGFSGLAGAPGGVGGPSLAPTAISIAASSANPLPGSSATAGPATAGPSPSIGAPSLLVPVPSLSPASAPTPALAANSVVATVSASTDPYGMAYDSANGNVYVANLGASTVSVINGLTDTLLATTDVGSAPYGIAYDPSSGYAYVTISSGDTVGVIQGATSLLHTIITVGTMPEAVLYDSANGLVYVGNYGTNTVTAITGSSNTVLGTITVEDNPSALVYDSADGYVYVTNEGSDTVSVIYDDTSVLATVNVESQPSALAYDSENGYVYAANYASGAVSVISGTSVVATVDVGSEVESMLYDPANGYVYVANYGSESISVISGTSVVATISTGYPYGQAYDPENGEIYVANSGGLGATTVSVVSGTTVVQTVTVGSNPQGILFDGWNGGIYAANRDGASVSVIDPGPVPVYLLADPPSGGADVGQTALFSVSLSAAGGVNSPTSEAWSALPGCPSGDSLDLSCVTGLSGSFSVGATVTDAFGVAASISLPAPYVVDTDPTTSTPVAVPASLDVGQPVSFSTVASGGAGGYSYGWTGLPSGCSSQDLAVLGCTPQASGTFLVDVTVTDQNLFPVTSGVLSLAISTDPQPSTPTATPPSVDLGQTATFSTVVSGGSGGTSYVWNGLPYGCPSSNSSSIGCTPTAPDRSLLFVQVTDSNGFSASSPELWFTAYADPVLSNMSVSRASLDLGQAATFSVKASSGSGGYSYAWGGLPTGCSSVNAATFLCTPTALGTFLTGVEVTDSNGYVVSSPKVSLTVLTDPSVSVPTAVPPSGGVDVGQAVTFSTHASGGTGAYAVYRWNYSSAAGLGCTPANGPEITCVPTAAGTDYAVAVSVSDSNGFTSPLAVLAPYIVLSDPAVTNPSSSRASVDLGQGVVFSTTASGGTGTYSTFTWSPSSGTLGCAVTTAAVLACRPTAPGTYTVAVSVTDTHDVTSQVAASSSFTVYALPTTTLPSPSATSVHVGQSFTISVSAVGGTGTYVDYTWSEPSPGLGCQLIPAPKISCAPTSAGTFVITVEVTDSNGGTGNASTTLTILAAPPAPSILPEGASSGAYAIVGGIAAVVAVIIVLLLRRRKRSSPAPGASASPPPGSPQSSTSPIPEAPPPPPPEGNQASSPSPPLWAPPPPPPIPLPPPPPPEA